MEPGVATREGKGAIKRQRMRKVILQNSADPPDADRTSDHMHKVQYRFADAVLSPLLSVSLSACRI